MSKNPYAKTVKPDKAYFVLSDHGWTWRVLKLYQTPAKSLSNAFARVFCLVSTPFVPDGELGDVYIEDIPGLREALQKVVETAK